MQKKVISLVLVLLLAITGLVRAEELTVNSGTVTNAYVPVYGFYADAYLKAEFVTPAADLASMADSDITSLRFQIDLPALDAWTGTFQVFLTEVDYTTMSAFQGIEGATIVYEGPLDGTGEQLVVNFTTPYTYHGGNLLIGVYQPTQPTCGHRWNTEPVGDVLHRRLHRRSRSNDNLSWRPEHHVDGCPRHVGSAVIVRLHL